MKLINAKTGLVLALAFGVSACGGGGGGGNGGSVNPPVTGPVSTSTEDLVDFANSGATSAFENGVMRTENSASGNGGTHTAYVDTLKGSKNGRVTYVNPNGKTVYRLVGDAPKKANAPSGVYTGEIDLSWKDGAKDKMHHDSGRMAIVLDLADGKANVDSIVGGNGANVIQVLGEAKVVGGTLKSNQMAVIVGDKNGGNMRRENGALNGVIAKGTGSSAIFGTVGSKNKTNGFEMTGGFSTGFDKEFTDQLK